MAEDNQLTAWSLYRHYMAEKQYTKAEAIALLAEPFDPSLLEHHKESRKFRCRTFVAVLLNTHNNSLVTYSTREEVLEVYKRYEKLYPSVRGWIVGAFKALDSASTSELIEAMPTLFEADSRPLPRSGEMLERTCLQLEQIHLDLNALLMQTD